MSIHNFNGCLCLVTDRGNSSIPEYLRTIELAIDSGVTMVQFRDKSTPAKLDGYHDVDRYRLGLQVRALTNAKGIPLIVNDRLDLAMAIDADGIHLGQHDLPISVAKSLWDPARIYGLSVSTEAEAVLAVQAGADYLGVGAILPTATKQDALVTGYKTLAEIVAAVRVPVIAIGGIGVANARIVMQTSCAGIAVVSAIWAAPDPVAATRNLAEIIACF